MQSIISNHDELIQSLCLAIQRFLQTENVKYKDKALLLLESEDIDVNALCNGENMLLAAVCRGFKAPRDKS